MDHTGTRSHGPHRKPHITTILNQGISDLIGYGALILTVLLCLIFLVRHYLLQGLVFKWLYGRIWTELSGHNRRSFMNHHIGGAIKLLVLFIGAYPWVKVLFLDSNLTDSLGYGSRVTMGDILFVLTQLFSCMYIFELLYREKLSPIAVAHHIGAIVIGQSAVVLSLDLGHQRDATLEFVMVFFYTSIIAVSGTIAETVMIAVLLAQSWSRWGLDFKIITPILHIVFTLAQLWGSWNLWCLCQSQKRKLAGVSDPETLKGPLPESSKKEDNDAGAKKQGLGSCAVAYPTTPITLSKALKIGLEQTSQ
ncbi:hypothetical protein EJ08DRAFT_656583 [Tothia fuscella]|uniref:TLC domain-containing protein n=1 Tax=Tothia fuscella TaxID=1048955 RepID=A0A9P4U362_9PEZI|nr:hypothetical protein EJ08DRAFT_656583 [Tothia fuscella]